MCCACARRGRSYNIKNRTIERFFLKKIRPSTRPQGGTHLARPPKKGPAQPPQKKNRLVERARRRQERTEDRRRRQRAGHGQRRHERRPDATSTGSQHGDKARTASEPTQAEPGNSPADAKQASSAGQAAGRDEPPTAGGTEPPQEPGATRPGRGTAEDRGAETRKAEDEPDGERAATKRSKQHNKHPQREK